MSNAYTFNLSSPSDFHDVDPTDVSAMVAQPKVLNEHHAIWGIGLYEEKRALYVHDIFEENVNIHLDDLCKLKHRCIALSMPPSTVLQITIARVTLDPP